MTSGAPAEPTTTGYAPNESRRAAALPSRVEEPFARQQRLQDRDPWASSRPPATLSFPPPPGLTGSSRTPATYPPFATTQAQRWAREEWSSRPAAPFGEIPLLSGWGTSPLSAQFPTSSTPMPPGSDRSPRSGYTAYQGAWPGPPLRRSSSEEARVSLGGYYGGDASSSTASLQGKAFPQRRPSNRDEFDGPSQLLDKPDDGGFEPKEEELPQLPITLYAQEQDEILSKVNDRLSQCAFDFVAKYQFPIPIEPDKRPVRVPGDREWSEWVYLLKRLATKRRIPARVLYNGQIKQLITILENSLEMRHAAKHQSRPLKDDRNILQLISSGLQVAKILKDAPAMQYLDSLYIQTERLIQSRRAPAPSASFTQM
ncbi:hypothetical protein PRZ48_008069 [Zasmidium cellare]|uniref:Uncharacterized protein n=1 Tax=Zasmidium cellare TaxID=395010 RepID=A0ABR0EFP9_ZASCE|nr:hypothetical protein PRZ48_008069 [Zasmidium cellare]